MIDREMSIATQIQRIQNLVSELRSNIQAKGVTLANDADLETCVDAVNEISGGGDTPSGYAAEYFTIENIDSSPATVYMRWGNVGATAVSATTINTATNANCKIAVPYTIEYSFDKSTWNSVYINTTNTKNITICTIPVGGKAYFRSNNNRIDYKAYNSSGYINFNYFVLKSPKLTPQFVISGNIMSLTHGDNFIGVKNTAPYEFIALFYSCDAIYDASNLILPATSLGKYAYAYMFSYCTNLITAPTLPATNLDYACYCGMFYSAENLKNTQSILPSLDLKQYCYKDMFMQCYELEKAPILPALKLQLYCYQSMFQNSLKINYIKAMFTTYPSGTYTTNWVNGVASTGTFVKNSAATWDVTGTYGIPSGWTVETAAA